MLLFDFFLRFIISMFFLKKSFSKDLFNNNSNHEILSKLKNIYLKYLGSFNNIGKKY